MEYWIDIIGIAVTAIGAAIAQEIRWRRKERAKANEQRAIAYERLLAVSDLCYSVLLEFADLQRGLGWWNGRSRLAVLRGTKLDERMADLMERLAAAVASVRMYGTQDGVVVAEDMLAAMSAPLLQQGLQPNEEFEHLTRSKAAFLDVVRREAGAPALAAA